MSMKVEGAGLGFELDRLIAAATQWLRTSITSERFSSFVLCQANGSGSNCSEGMYYSKWTV